MIGIVEHAEAERGGRESERQRCSRRREESRSAQERAVREDEPPKDDDRLASRPRITNWWSPAAGFRSKMNVRGRPQIAPKAGLRGKTRHLADWDGGYAPSNRLVHRRKLRRLGPEDWPASFSR